MVLLPKTSNLPNTLGWRLVVLANVRAEISIVDDVGRIVGGKLSFSAINSHRSARDAFAMMTR